MPPQETPERDQQVPSNNHSLPPCNSPQSLFNGNVEDTTPLASESDYYNFQIKTIVKFREIIKNIANLEQCILSLNSNNIVGSVDNLDEFENNGNRDQTLRCGKLSHLKILSTLIKNSAHSMGMHLAKNPDIVSNPGPENGVRPFDSFKDNPQNLNKQDVIQELMKNLVEIYTKKLMSKHNLEKLQLKINHINSNCKKCEKSCMLAALTTHKILLIVSLNNKNKDIFSLIKKLIEDVLKILACEDCRVGSRSQTGSEISRISPHISSSLNQLSPKPSCSTHVLKGKIFSTAPNATDVSRTDVSSLGYLHNKPSSSVPSLFSYQTGFESQISADDDSPANVTISKASCREAISNFNCKTKTDEVVQPSCYSEKRCQRELKAADNGSLCFETPSRQSQNQSEVKTVHNSSLGFTTPTCCTSLYDRASISGNSTPQPSTRTPNNIQNNSFSYEAELQSCKDNAHFEQKDNGKNYSSNIRKKIFREKGLLNTQRRNCKSAEVIADSESESLRHSNAKIQKHLSEPHFLSPACKSSTERVLNRNEEDEHFYANVEILDGKREIDGENADANRYWSPFHRSDCNGHPNILDIPNWSAKSSHSMKQIDQDSNQRTMQDRVDVTLKNEGKGYGLSIEFLGSTLEDSIQVPRITAVSSQGAAHKVGILQKGDRILAINGQNTTGLTVTEFDHLKEEAFSADEVSLTVEFDIVVRDLHFGTFDVSVTKTSKTGLIYNDFKKGSPLVVKGIVKGSPAHRCGSLFPGDEVLYANNIRQEFYDVFKNTYERTESVIIRVRRQTFKEKFGDEINLDQTEPSPFKTYDLTRTSIHSNHDSNNMFLEQELTLYRDPVARDFGFLIGQDQASKTIYVIDIRPDGPADCSKVIKKNDIILQVNGIDLEANKDGPVVSLFHPTGDRLELKTRRILKNYHFIWFERSVDTQRVLACLKLRSYGLPFHEFRPRFVLFPFVGTGRIDVALGLVSAAVVSSVMVVNSSHVKGRLSGQTASVHPFNSSAAERFPKPQWTLCM
ncbi:Glutamate receptor-interacting protein 2 [Araneus ventricosus]|uniref:Glutamate receptor-interacting protein 2 n=1 Tax=Araneus ventricosus TaxID=182803 RepID=A0A4Y2PUE1_ARAVE|nr:Glutamate receptor-interacting protein 2 [Araneus ventricosus]